MNSNIPSLMYTLLLFLLLLPFIILFISCPHFLPLPDLSLFFSPSSVMNTLLVLPAASLSTYLLSASSFPLLQASILNLFPHYPHFLSFVLLSVLIPSSNWIPHFLFFLLSLLPTPCPSLPSFPLLSSPVLTHSPVLSCPALPFNPHVSPSSISLVISLTFPP